MNQSVQKFGWTYYIRYNVANFEYHCIGWYETNKPGATYRKFVSELWSYHRVVLCFKCALSIQTNNWLPLQSEMIAAIRPSSTNEHYIKFNFRSNLDMHLYWNLMRRSLSLLNIVYQLIFGCVSTCYSNVSQNAKYKHHGRTHSLWHFSLCLPTQRNCWTTTQ